MAVVNSRPLITNRQALPTHFRNRIALPIGGGRKCAVAESDAVTSGESIVRNGPDSQFDFSKHVLGKLPLEFFMVGGLDDEANLVE